MTIPFLSNCPHSDDSWCLGCTSKLGHDYWAEQAKVAALRIALRRSMVAIDDWLNIYASEFCQFERVQEAKERIREVGTLAYIGDVQQVNRAAMACSDSQASDGA